MISKATTPWSPPSQTKVSSWESPVPANTPHKTEKTQSRAVVAEDDYFYRRALRRLCTQTFPPFAEDFSPQASRILPSLYLCDVYTATTPSVLARLGITHVVSVIDGEFFQSRSSEPIGPTIKRFKIPVEDAPSVNIRGYFQRGCAWIHHALNGVDGERDREQKVLVHCMWGASRSHRISDGEKRHVTAPGVAVCQSTS
jgi:atypical dual specificity phosphatase